MQQLSTIDNYLWPNRYMLKFIGFWPAEVDLSNTSRFFSHTRLVVSIAVALTLFVPEILMVIVHWGNISILTGVGCIAIAVGQLVFKLLYMIVRRRRFRQIYYSARDFWTMTNDAEERENFEKLAKIAKQCTIIFFVSGVSNVATFTTASIVVWIKNYVQANESTYSRNLPFDLWYGVDSHRTPNFEIIFFGQVLAMVFCAVGVVGFDATMMTLILHICGQFRLVRARFYAIGDRIRKDTNSKFLHSSQLKIGQCIEHHQRTIRIAEEMDGLLSPVLFVQLTTSGVEICLTGYALIANSENNDRAEVTKFVFYVVTIFLQLLIWCWPGELLIQESTAVGEAACYEMPWYALTVHQQKDLSFVIMRAQKECQVTALGYQVMSLRKMTEVFNTAASYFTLLRSVSEKQIA